jgi:hypothetical protein
VKLSRPDLAALIVLGVIVAAIAACAIARVEVPSILPELGLLLSGIAGGAAIPSSGWSSSPAPAPELPSPAPAPAPQAFLPPVVPTARTLTTDTGVIPRVATHQ